MKWVEIDIIQIEDTYIVLHDYTILREKMSKLCVNWSGSYKCTVCMNNTYHNKVFKTGYKIPPNSAKITTWNSFSFSELIRRIVQLLH